MSKTSDAAMNRRWKKEVEKLNGGIELGELILPAGYHLVRVPFLNAVPGKCFVITGEALSKALPLAV